MTAYPPVFPGEGGVVVEVAEHGWDDVTAKPCAECSGVAAWRPGGHTITREAYVLQIEAPWVVVQWRDTGRWEMVDIGRVRAGWGS